MRINLKAVLLLTVALMAGASVARAVVGTATTITFGELSQQPVNGLSLSGVTFGFKMNGVNSTDATFGATLGPVGSPLLMPPHLEGNSLGLLTMDFSTPIVFLQFGAHLSIEAAVAAALGVQLFDSSMTPVGGLMSLDMTPSPDFAGVLFQYNGAEASHAMIQFNGQEATRFALDNLMFVPVPEPNLAWLIVPALAGGIYLRRQSASRA